MKPWLAFVFAASLLGQSRNVLLPDETAGWGRIYRALISAFDRVDIVALGEDHGRKLDSDLRIGLIRDPDFATKVHSIVVEFASTSEQQTLDRYVQGEEVSVAELARVWETTTQRGVWESPIYADFFAVVREVNAKRPAPSRIRVLGGDPGIGDYRTRDGAAVSVLKEQVLDKHEKALVIYGSGHLFRAQGAIDYQSAIGGGITRTLEPNYPGRVFVVITLGGPDSKYGKFEQALHTPARPVLLSLHRQPFEDYLAEEFIGNELLKRLPNGRLVGVFQGSGLTLAQLADACVYWGMGADADLRVRPDR